MCSPALMLLKTRVHVSNPRGGGAGGWARADPAQKGEGEPRSRMPPVAAGPPAALGSGSPSARALGTAQLTPLPSSAPRSSGGPGRTTCSSGTGRRSPRQRSCWRTCEPPCRWVTAAPGPHVPPSTPSPAQGPSSAGSVTRRVTRSPSWSSSGPWGKPPAETPEAGRWVGRGEGDHSRHLRETPSAVHRGQR